MTKRRLRAELAQEQAKRVAAEEALYHITHDGLRQCISPACGVQCRYAVAVEKRAYANDHCYTGIAYMCGRYIVCGDKEPIPKKE